MQNLIKLKLQALLAVFFLTSSVNALERTLSIDFQSPVLAERGGTLVTQLDVDARLAEIPEPSQANILSDPSQIQKLIESILSTQFLADKLINSEMMEDPVLQARVYQAVIGQLAAIYRDKVLQENMLSDYTQQAREMYLRDPGLYKSVGEISFKHILINNENDNSKQFAEELEDLIETGEDIQQLAMQHSDDRSVEQNQGSFTRIPLNQLDPQFRAGAEQIEPGQMEVIESSFGWHLVRVEAYYEPGQLEFEAVAEGLKIEAEAKHKDEILGRLVREAYTEPLNIQEGAIGDLLERHEASTSN